MIIEEITVIGAGPSGLAAAIQLKRYGMDPWVVEKTAIGGLLRNANLVENYPGFPGGIPGPRLVRLFEEQAGDARLRVSFDQVVRLDLADKAFLVETKAHVHASRAVVVASGTKPRKPADLVIPQDVEERVFYEVHPLLKAEGKKIAVLGGGDAAFDYALTLGKANEVIILHRGDAPHCLPLLQERAKGKPEITYMNNVAVTRIMRDSPESILLDTAGPRGVARLAAHYLVIAVGREPQLDFLAERIRGDSRALERDGNLAFVGDVKNDVFRQVSIAVGDGVLAAMRMCRRRKESDA
jgi:thioredoxin reductase